MSDLIIENKKITKKGDVWYINIPKALVDSGVLSPEKEYNIIIKDSENKNQDKNQPIEVLP